MGSYAVSVSLCAAGAVQGCAAKGFVGVSNATACKATFDLSLQRPIGDKDGLRMRYGSSISKNDDAEVMVRCDATGSAAPWSKTKKFMIMTPNKKGGSTYRFFLFSSVACGVIPPTPEPSSDLPPMPTGGSGSSGMPPMPTGGSGSSGMPSMPSGGSGSSGMPSGNSGSGGMPSIN